MDLEKESNELKNDMLWDLYGTLDKFLDKVENRKQRVNGMMNELERRVNRSDISDKDYRVQSGRYMKLNNYMNRLNDELNYWDKKKIYNVIYSGRSSYDSSNDDSDYQGRYYEG